MRTNSEHLTPREVQEIQYEKEAWERQAQHQIALKNLEIQVMKEEARWGAWIKLPKLVILLPVLLLLVIPLSIYAATKQEVPEFYQRFFK